MMRRWFWLKWWLLDRVPVFCAHCGRLIFSKDSRSVTLLTGGRVKICKKCYSDIFNAIPDPFKDNLEAHHGRK